MSEFQSTDPEVSEIPEELETDEQFLLLSARVLRVIEAMRQNKERDYVEVDGIQYRVINYDPTLDHAEETIKKAIDFEKNNPKNTDQRKSREIFWMLMRDVADDDYEDSAWGQLGLDIRALEEYFCVTKMRRIIGI